MTRIVVVGSANVDFVVQTPHIPRPGETMLGRNFVIAIGGKGANQAVGAARLGADVSFVACIGEDVFGDQCLEAYHAEGIHTEFVQPRRSRGDRGSPDLRRRRRRKQHHGGLRGQHAPDSAAYRGGIARLPGCRCAGDAA